MPTDDAVTVLLDRLQDGDSMAVRILWEKYFHRLVALARTRLRNSPRRVSDEEDVALSAFNSFCVRAEAGRFPDLSDRESLWRLLVEFTLRKACHHKRDAAALKRGGGRAMDGASGVLDEVLTREPQPAVAAEMAERYERLLALLKEPKLRQIAVLRMEGHKVEEVGAKVGYAPKSVKRKLSLIRKIWLESGELP
jgi:DNA-directed RNA polymerase specialized sigma24 family protein